MEGRIRKTYASISRVSIESGVTGDDHADDFPKARLSVVDCGFSGRSGANPREDQRQREPALRPSTDSSRLATLAKNSEVTLLQPNPSSGFYHVHCSKG